MTKFAELNIASVISFTKWSMIPCYIVGFLSGENYSLNSQLYLLIFTSHSVYTSDKTAFPITSKCLTLCWRKVNGILHPWSTTTSFEIKATLWLVVKGALTDESVNPLKKENSWGKYFF